MTSLRAVLVGCAFFVSTFAEAVDLTVFGLPPLGTQFSAPGCKQGQHSLPAKPKEGFCYWQRGNLMQFVSKPLPKTGHVYVDFPKGEDPSISVRGWVEVRLIDGKIEGVSFSTYETGGGYTLKSLATKYGAPKSLSKPELQNSYGARITGTGAAWSFPELEVTFDAPYLGTKDEGRVEIKSRLAANLDDKRLMDRVSKQRKL